MLGYGEITSAFTLILLNIRHLFIFLIIFLITACGTHSDAVYQSTFNFNKVKTYSIYQRNSSFTTTQNLTDSQRNSIEIAIEKAIEQHGFKYTTVEQADIVITYHLLNGKIDAYRDYNKEVLFCQHCLKANNWYNEGSALKVKRGSLIIDLIDPQRKRSIWRNIAPLRLKDKDNSRVVNDKIQQEVTTMLQQYPYSTLNNKQ